MIGYYTDNSVARNVMGAVQMSGIEVRHIDHIDPTKPAIFYGILRGAGLWQHYYEQTGIDYWYIDNGYYDAIYRDSTGFKEAGGTYRICKNERITQYKRFTTGACIPKSVLILPPTEYTAFMNGTTPEDWMISLGITIPHTVRRKETKASLLEQIEQHDAVIAFNSMAVMDAVRLNKGLATTHGIFPFTKGYYDYYNYNDLLAYYTDKQFTLEQISKGLSCLS
jgi:hypothetical protein